MSSVSVAAAAAAAAHDHGLGDPSVQGRAKGVSVVKPIVYGNVARYFGKKREEDGHTHQWTVYVKPYRNEDMSVYVKKIHFRLHESYANPNRVVTKPPYEVTETGWGEFEIVIKIYFQDPNERPVTLYHILKLFQTGPDMMLGKKTLVSEFYEEMVFHEPTVPMHHLLTSPRQLLLGPWKHDTDFDEKQKQTLAAVLTAKAKIQAEISSLKEHLKLAKETILFCRDRITQVQSQGVAAAVPAFAATAAAAALHSAPSSAAAGQVDEDIEGTSAATSGDGLSLS